MSLSDPLRGPGKTPRRAEPQQPDRVGRGDDALGKDENPSSGRSSESEKQSNEDRIEQIETALDNVRNP